MRMKNKFKGRRLLRSAAAMICLAMMFFTMSGMAMATDMEDAPAGGALRIAQSSLNEQRRSPRRYV